LKTRVAESGRGLAQFQKRCALLSPTLSSGGGEGETTLCDHREVRHVWPGLNYLAWSTGPDARRRSATAISSHEGTSHNRMYCSGSRRYPTARVRPSGENFTDMQPPGSFNVATSCSVAMFQSFTQSSAAVASVLPSGENATPTTGRRWPMSVALSAPEG